MEHGKDFHQQLREKCPKNQMAGQNSVWKAVRKNRTGDIGQEIVIPKQRWIELTLKTVVRILLAGDFSGIEAGEGNVKHRGVVELLQLSWSTLGKKSPVA